MQNILSAMADPEFSDKDWEPNEGDDDDSNAEDGYQQTALGMLFFLYVYKANPILSELI